MKNFFDNSRFFKFVKMHPKTGCWIWMGCRDALGYGRFGIGGRKDGTIYAYRAAWKLFYGKLPRRPLELDHLCCNPSCVNPDHLEAVTHAENMRRAAERKTHCINGHPYNDVYVQPSNGSRRCMICQRASERRRVRVRKT